MIEKNVSWDAYCQMPEMNSSKLIRGRTSMLKMKEAIDGHSPSTGKMRFGSQMHSILLTPDEFSRTHRVMPDYKNDEENVDSKGESKQVRKYNLGTR